MRIGLSIAALMSAAGAAGTVNAALLPRAIFSEVAASPTSQVTTTLGTATIESIDRPYRSLNNDRWVIGVNLLTPTGGTHTTSNDDLVISGQGLTWAVRAQEGVTVIEPGRTIDTGQFAQRIAINDDGDIVYNGSLNGATSDDEVVVRDVGGVLTIFGREATAIPGIAGSFHGTLADGVNIANDGTVGYRTSGITPTVTNQTVAVLRNDGGILDGRTGVFTPTGLAAGTEAPVQFMDTDGYFVAANGTDWFLSGDTSFATTTQDDFWAVNGAVVIQEGFPIPGAANTNNVDGLTEGGMNPNGTWWGRGSFATTPDTSWVVNNGTVVAESSGMVNGQFAGEVWTSFFSFAASDTGDYVVGGSTDNADTTRNAVLVYNGVEEILREGDAVDLDGNGLADDGVFINFFGNDDMILDGNKLYFVTTLKDATGASLGDAYLTITIPGPGGAALLGVGAVLLGARRRR